MLLHEKPTQTDEVLKWMLWSMFLMQQVPPQKLYQTYFTLPISPVSPSRSYFGHLSLSLSLYLSIFSDSSPRRFSSQNPSISSLNSISRLMSTAFSIIGDEYLSTVLTNKTEVASGSSAYVFRGVRSDTNAVVAIKEVRLSIEEPEKIIDRFRETHNIVCDGFTDFHGVFYGTRDSTLTVVTEYMDCGSIDDILRQRKAPFPEDIVAMISFRLVSSLQKFHHDFHAIHRDIKPSNILVNSLGKVKFSDLGVSGNLKTSLGKANTFVGSTEYMSPERIKGQKHSYSSDTWSLGLTLFKMIVGKIPYESESGVVANFYSVMTAITQNESPALLLSSEEYSFSTDCKEFFQECLDKESESRPTPGELLGHRFVQYGESIYSESALSEFFQPYIMPFKSS